MVPNVLYILPEVIVLSATLLIITVELFLEEEKKRYLAYVAIASLWLAALASAPLIGVKASLLGNMFVVDSFGIVLKVIILIAGSMAIFLSIDFLNFPRSKQGEYYSLVLFSILGMMIMASSINLIAIFLGIQLASIPIYILVGFQRFDVKSNEAALKYFLLGILTAAATLYGMSLIYGLTGTLHLAEIAERLTHINLNDPVLFMGMTFIVAGFTFKIAAVPFHFWAPDTYEGAPTPVTAFIAAVPKVAGFAALTRLVFTAFPEFTPQWIGLFGIAATLTMFTGNILAIPQRNIKRMLAFSGIAHVGYALIALAVTNEHALSALIIYLIAYAAMNLGAFAVVIAVARVSPEHLIEDYAGLSRRAPLMAGAMTIFLLSMVGFPTTAGFIAKFLVFSAAVERGFIWLAIIGVLNSVISLYYYFGVVRQMYMEPPRSETPVRPTWAIGAVMVVALLVVMVLGLFFEPFIELARSITLINVKF
ncbi:MAG: NADH-quinone oxidoreductase subunit N [Actinomycetota bacterium]